MGSKCLKCGSVESQACPLASCDNCLSKLCQECAELTTTELRGVLLKKRSIIYYCPDCRTDMVGRRVPDISGALPDLIASACEAYFLKLSARLDGFRDDVVGMYSGIKKDVELIKSMAGGAMGCGAVDAAEIAPGPTGTDRNPKAAADSKRLLKNRPRKDGITIDDTKRAIQSINKQLLVDKQSEIMGEVLRLTEPIEPVNPAHGASVKSVVMTGSSDPLDGVHESGFSVVSRRKRGRRPTVMGSRKLEPSDDNSFTGADRRIWLYVGKTSTHTTEEVVHDYLRRSAGGEDFTVSKLSYKGTYPSFKVSAPFNLKEKLQDPNFWPSGVLVRRFLFKRSENFQRESGCVEDT